MDVFNKGDELIMRALELGFDMTVEVMRVISEYYMDRQQ